MSTFWNILKKVGPIIFILVILLAPLCAVHAAEEPGLKHCIPGVSELVGAGNFDIQLCVAQLGNLMLYMVSWILWAAGVLLNFTVKFTILDATTTINGISGINTAWRVLRDLANMGVIFFLLYAAIGTIIQSSKANLKKTIIGIVMMALFINFSLYITKLFIDASNIATIEIYRALGPACSTDPNSQSSVNRADGCLSDTFMSQLRLTTVYDRNTKEATGVTGVQISNTADPGKIIVATFMGSAVIIIAAVAFFAVTIMLVMRFVTFVFLLILSPLAFAGFAFPQIPSSKWWKALFDNVIFAPVYFLLVWISLSVMRTTEMLNKDAKFSDAFLGSPTALGAIILNYVIIIFFIIYAMVWAKKAGVAGASYGTKLGGKLAFGTVASLGRNTFGRAAKNIGDSELLKRLEASRIPGGGLLRKGFQNVGGRTFDLRNNEAIKSAKVDFGKVTSKGFSADLKAAETAAVKRAKDLAPSAMVIENKQKKATRKFEKAQRRLDLRKEKITGLRNDYADAQKKAGAEVVDLEKKLVQNDSERANLEAGLNINGKNERVAELQKKGAQMTVEETEELTQLKATIKKEEESIKAIELERPKIAAALEKAKGERNDVNANLKEYYDSLIEKNTKRLDEERESVEQTILNERNIKGLKDKEKPEDAAKTMATESARRIIADKQFKREKLTNEKGEEINDEQFIKQYVEKNKDNFKVQGIGESRIERYADKIRGVGPVPYTRASAQIAYAIKQGTKKKGQAEQIKDILAELDKDVKDQTNADKEREEKKEEDKEDGDGDKKE